MELLHYKESGDSTKHFECCGKKVIFYDSVSCNESMETCIMECKTCKTKYYQEITLGQQYNQVIGSEKTGFPHFSTFTLPRNL